MASKMTFHESYGDVTVAQLRAYKKYNVSPSDHDELVRECNNDPKMIVDLIQSIVADKGHYSGYWIYND